MRGFVCDLSERALLFRCMVAGLSSHFHNFPWLCKVFSQTSLHFASHFYSLEVILYLGDHLAAKGKKRKTFSQPMEKIETFSQPILKLENHFIAIWKFENHLVAKGHFRSTWRIWQGVAMGLRNHFAAKWDFRSRVPFSQPISQLRNGVTVLRNGTRVPRGGFAAAKIFAEGGMGLRNHFAEKWRFRRGLFLAAKFRRPLNFYAFELLLIPNFLLSLLLTFLLILIIQKPILHQNKLELKH